MRKKASEALHGQAEILVGAAAAAARWFHVPGLVSLTAARTARLRSRAWRDASVAASQTRSGPAKTDACDLSFALREAVEQTVAAVSEAARWGVCADAAFAAAADALEDAARDLKRAAAAAASPARADALLEAKRHAAVVERRCRAVRAEAHESPAFVESVKRSAISARLSSAAEALQQACDALAGGLSE
ncbi:MAG: hypothetical protein A2X40_04840 [Elusimicrobia bacterium GWC2_65_9]|nr:MAG: hypothetical protein A2X37_07965 [Elusimicrobia bacterium GWA2_66_18]OGR70571.1 MAG: hypothetical protein A2X40_04840 [Elusimicrobia bacterium GWC2_65_9]